MDENQQTKYDSLGQRVASHEAQLRLLTEDVRSISQSVSALTTSQSAGFERLMSRIDSATRPNMGVMGAWAGVVLTIGGMIGSSYVRDITRIEADGKSALNKFELETITHLDRLDIVLQREMRLLNDTIETQITGLDTVLQREISLNMEASRALSTSLTNDAISLRTELSAREVRVREMEENLARIEEFTGINRASGTIKQ